MNRYTIYCTPEQTKKALELGAPADRGHEGSRYFNIGMPTYYDENDEICRVKNSIIFIPTTEEMLGWLEEQGFKFKIYEKFKNSWFYYVGYIGSRAPVEEFDNVKSRTEATIDAINAALEYLTNLK